MSLGDDHGYGGYGGSGPGGRGQTRTRLPEGDSGPYGSGRRPGRGGPPGAHATSSPS